MNIMGKGPLGLKGEKATKAPRKPIRQRSRPENVCEPGKTFVSKVLRDFAKGNECQMKSEWCNGDRSTTVLCHSRRLSGAGTGQKPHDFWAYHGCSDCHRNEDRIEFRELYTAIMRTQKAVFDEFQSLTPL